MAPRKRHTKHTEQPSLFTRPIFKPDSPIFSNLAQKICKRFHWEHGVKPFQLEATKAQLLGKDTVVHASTGSGKTAIAAAPHVLDEVAGMVSLFVSPLLTLHVEMTKAFKDEYGMEAIAVNSLIDGDTKKLYKEIVQGKYQIVLLAPEMLTHRRFIEDVLKSNEFTSRLLSIIIDEAQCVSFWGQSFRKAYAELGIVRAFIHPSTPIIAMSGTLAPRVRRDVLNKLGFSPGKYLVIDIGNARPNVSIAVLPSKHALNSFHDLYFVIPPNVEALSDIPKTFLYCDDKETGYDIIDYLRSRLPEELWTCIRPFNASLSPEYREAAMLAFKIGLIRILVCTEAAGMGCNIPDIELVVQWKLTNTFSAFIQRAGRAVRDPNLKGVAILIAEPGAYRIDPTVPVDIPTETEKVPQRQGKVKPTVKQTEIKGFKSNTPAAPELREDSPGEGIYAFVQTTLCRRKIWDQVYGNFPPTIPKDGVACCDLCDSSLLNQFMFLPPERQRQGARVRQGVPDPGVIEKLETWRTEAYVSDFPTANWTEDALLKDDFISKLAALGPIESKSQIAAVLERTWTHWSRYGDSLFNLLSNFAIAPFQPLPAKTRKPTNTELPTSAQANVPEPHANRKRKQDAGSSLMPTSNSRPRLNNTPVQALVPQASTPPLRAPPVVPSQRQDTGYPTIQAQNLGYERIDPRHREVLPHFEGYNAAYGRPVLHAGAHQQAPFPSWAPPANAISIHGTPPYPARPPYANQPQFFCSHPPNLNVPNTLAHFHPEPPGQAPAVPPDVQHLPAPQYPFYYYQYPEGPQF